MFWPPGQLVASKYIGQFSMHTSTLFSSARSRMGSQTAGSSSRFSSRLLSVTRPMKVVTLGTPSLDAASMHASRWSLKARRRSGSGSRLLG